MEAADESTIRAALNVYNGVKRRYDKYRRAHLDVHNACSSRTYYKMKEDPERYAAYLEKRRIYQRLRNAKKRGGESSTPETLDDST